MKRSNRIMYPLVTVAAMAVLISATALGTRHTQPTSAAPPPPGPSADWSLAGHDLGNTRDAAAEHILGAHTVAGLTPAWSIPTAGGVTATPTEDGGTLYFPDTGGNLWAVAADSGQVRWSHRVAEYTGVTGDVVRDSPAVYGNELVVGDSTYAAMAGARLMAVDKRTGTKLWQTVIDTHPAATVTSSPVIVGNTIYVGISSSEEVVAVKPGYHCCTFRGSVIALDATTGHIKWKTYTVPTGYSGGGVWGSAPAVDPVTGLLYVATGNNYSVPAGVCAAPGQRNCAQPQANDYSDSILALDMTTGAIRWSRSATSYDVWTAVCDMHPSASCGSDFDFGSAPNLIRLPSGRQLVGVGQKSGVYWALDPGTGAVVWRTIVGPGSNEGGIQWGSATDGQRIYVAIGNFYGESYRIPSAAGQASTIAGGSWAALDAATGRILWQVADPQHAADIGYVTSGNGVVYAGSTAATGNDMYALDAATGRVLWNFASGGPVVAGAAIVRGTVYWGSGFKFSTSCPTGRGPMRVCGSGVGKMYAFHLPTA